MNSFLMCEGEELRYLFLPGQVLVWVSDELFYKIYMCYKVLFSGCKETHKQL